MSLQNENIEREVDSSLFPILRRVRSNLEDYVRDNKSADERFEKFRNDNTEPKGLAFFFLSEESENTESEGIGLFIVRHNESWSFPICIEVNNLDFKTQSKTNSPLYIVILRDQHVVDTFIHQEEIDFATDINKDIDSIFTLLPNKMDSVSINNLFIKNYQKLNQEYYGSRFTFAVILRGKLQQCCVENYDALIKFVNEKIMPKELSSTTDQSGTIPLIGNKFSEFKQTAGTQLGIAKEQLGNAMYNVKNKAEELVSNVQSILINDSGNTETETVTVSPVIEDKSKLEQGDFKKSTSTDAKMSTLEAGKEKIKETFSNIKDKASEKVEDLKSNIENKFTSDNTAFDTFDQNKSISEKTHTLPSPNEDTKSKNKDVTISNVPLYRNVDSNSRKDIREKQPLQEKPEDETKSFGSKLHDAKGFAEDKLTTAREKMEDTLKNAKTKTQELITNIKPDTNVNHDSGREKKDKMVESPVQKSKDLPKQSTEKESDNSLGKALRNFFIGSGEDKDRSSEDKDRSGEDKDSKDKNDYIDHELRQNMRESQPLFQQEPPQKDESSIGSKLNDIKESVKDQFETIKEKIESNVENLTGKDNVINETKNMEATRNDIEDLDK